MPDVINKVKKVLYLGLDPSRFPVKGELVHTPVIRTQPRSFEEVAPFFEKFYLCSHVLFSSRSPIPIFFSYAEKVGIHMEVLKERIYITLGKATSIRLSEFGVQTHFCSHEETAEGVVELLKKISFKQGSLFFPHSAQSREVIISHLKLNQIPHLAFPLYDTLLNPIKLPDISEFDEIIFTSPSTVKAFIQLAGSLPPKEKCRPIGPITSAYLMRYLK